jgi:thiamine transport system ATP-binding protein
VSLSCRDITVTYGDFVALSDVDLEVADGHRLSIVGPSGCGKSTLLRVIAGLVTPATGSVWLGDRDITSVAPHERSIGLMFQEHALFPHRDVAGNVGFGLRMQDEPPEQIEHRVDELLALMGLGDRRHSRIDELSGGERQRVALARTLAPDPDIVLLDEPLASLDRVLRTDLLDEITEIFADLHITAIAVSHDIEEAFRFGTHVAVMAPARIDRKGPSPEVWADPSTTYTAEFLGFAPVVPFRSGAAGLETPIGTLQVDAETDATHVAVAPGGLTAADGGPLTGSVARAGFEQGRWRHLVVLADGSEVVVHAERRHDGDMRLEVDLDAVRFVQPTSSAV